MKNKIIRGVPFRLSDLEASHRQDDVTTPQKYQLLRVGTFNDPRFGSLEITEVMLQDMVRNFETKARGVDIAIDFSHDNHKEAAGWVTGLELRENNTELWAEVKWTDKGHFAIANKEYRYLSSEFMTNYSDNESKQNFGTVLLGAGLTNRPVVKRMHPIVELTEGSEHIDNNQEGDKEMEELKAEIEQLKAKIAELEAKATALAGEKAAVAEQAATAETSLSEAKTKLTESEAKVTTLTEEKVKLTEAKAKAEKEAKFEVLLADGKAVPAQKEAFLSDDMAKYIELSGDVNLGEKGNGGGGGEKPGLKKGESVQTKIAELADKALEDKKAGTMKEAISLVLSENPKLSAAYEKENETLSA